VRLGAAVSGGAIQNPGKPVRDAAEFLPAINLARTDFSAARHCADHSSRCQALGHDCSLLLLRPMSPPFPSADNLNSRHRTSLAPVQTPSLALLLQQPAHRNSAKRPLRDGYIPSANRTLIRVRLHEVLSPNPRIETVHGGQAETANVASDHRRAPNRTRRERLLGVDSGSPIAIAGMTEIGTGFEYRPGANDRLMRRIAPLRSLLQPLVASREVKAFGCQPIVKYRAAQRAGVRKPPGTNPREAGLAVGVYGELIGRRLRRGAG